MLDKTHANPFNWVGSKFRYIDTVLTLLPDTPNLKVLDPFVGGGDLISKLPSSWDVTCADNMPQIIELHKAFQSGEITLFKLQREYDRRGLSKDNKEAYISLREEYNKTKDIFLLYLLITSGFNNQIRFNKSGEFNMPFGKRQFNDSMKQKVENYSRALCNKNINFTCCGYDEFNFADYDLLLLDPPYVNTVATYNESTGWNSNDDKILFDKIDSSGSKFIYFNQPVSKGVENIQLIEWMRKYNVIELGDTSRGCNHQRDNKLTREVLVHCL